ncbi:hypothetical protein ZWY2020_043094, partial [Hordeum vulgare]
PVEILCILLVDAPSSHEDLDAWLADNLPQILQRMCAGAGLDWRLAEWNARITDRSTWQGTRNHMRSWRGTRGRWRSRRSLGFAEMRARGKLTFGLCEALSASSSVRTRTPPSLGFWPSLVYSHGGK